MPPCSATRAFARAAVRVPLAVVCAGVLSGGCDEVGAPRAETDGIREPTAITFVDGRWALVANGNWDRGERSGTVAALDLRGLAAGLADPAAPTTALTAAAPCRRSAAGAPYPIECSATALVDEAATIAVGTGVGEVAIDRGRGEGQVRGLVTVRDPASVVWFDLRPDADSLRLECGQQEERGCDEAHRIVAVASDPARAFPSEPARVVLDRDGFRFGYVPHLLGGRLSLLTLDGPRGPELTDIEEGFYQPDPFADLDAAGGIAVAQRACGPDPSNIPDATEDCTRPLLVASQRWWPGIREFTVAPGLDVLLAGVVRAVGVGALGTFASRPLLADLAFVDEASGERLVAVQTTPPTLLELDGRVDEGRITWDRTRALPLCSGAARMWVQRPVSGEPLAFVACSEAASIAVIGLDRFSVIASVPVVEDPGALTPDADGRWLWVASTEASAFSLIGLDPAGPGYLREHARVR